MPAFQQRLEGNVWPLGSALLKSDKQLHKLEQKRWQQQLWQSCESRIWQRGKVIERKDLWETVLTTDLEGMLLWMSLAWNQLTIACTCPSVGADGTWREPGVQNQCLGFTSSNFDDTFGQQSSSSFGDKIQHCMDAIVHNHPMLKKICLKIKLSHVVILLFWSSSDTRGPTRSPCCYDVVVFDDDCECVCCCCCFLMT